MSKVVADLNEKQERILKAIKRIGYIANYEVSTKPQQISLGLDILEILLGQLSDEQLFNILKDERA